MSDRKKANAAQKPQLQLIPPVSGRAMAAAMQHGAVKYGERNWLKSGIDLTVYLGAMRRHIDAIIDGEDIDPESGCPHLGHIMASCGIVLDAEACGVLKDDRILPPKKEVHHV